MTVTEPVSASSHHEEMDSRRGWIRLPRRQSSTIQPQHRSRRRRVRALIWRAMLGAAYTAGGAVVTLAAKWAITML
ncbi:hypothetical protein AB0L49_23705 [Streptomyces antimycoticus]|uniref:hypothetical protein n=1 Tax=Streptomyces antimycoticus TaxID=68175 RepID=UPI00343DA64D